MGRHESPHLFIIMPLKLVTGDPRLSQAEALAFGHNARGRTELGDFETALMQQEPAAFASYQRRGRKTHYQPGTIWPWYQSKPFLFFLVIRQSSVGATRLRYVQSVLLTLARDYRLYNIKSLAIAPLGNDYERPEIITLIEQWLGNIDLPVIAYTDYDAGKRADE